MTRHDNLAEHRLKKDNPRHQFRGQPIISDQITREGLEVVCSNLEAVLDKNIPGAVAEFGCYAGTTSLFIRRILDERGQSATRPFHVYDSFEGLPEKTTQDKNAAGTDFTAGKLYVTKKEFIQEFKSARLDLPVIHKGWFDQLAANDVPEPIALAFLDGDFYGSIISSLRLIWPKMSEGGIILIDDYQRETLPGVERAIRDFFQGKQIKRLRATANIAIIEL
jgi:O-methyltransferase